MKMARSRKVALSMRLPSAGDKSRVPSTTRIPWSTGIVRLRIARCRRLHRFLDVDQAEAAFFCAAFANSEQYRKAQPAEEAAPFHPVGGIQHFVNARAGFHANAMPDP